jgi:hypothetical protein
MKLGTYITTPEPISTAWLNKKFWEELIAYFPWYDMGHIEKRRVQQFCCCMCICYRSNVSSEPLPSNDKGMFNEPLHSNDRGIRIQTHRLMWGIFSLLSLCWKNKVGLWDNVAVSVCVCIPPFVARKRLGKNPSCRC